MTRLTLPNAGGIEVIRGYVAPDAIDSVNAAYNSEARNTFNTFVYHKSLESWLSDLSQHDSRSRHLLTPIENLTRMVIAEALRAWEFDFFALYVRELGEAAGNRSLATHNDVDQDIRVLVEGHGARWLFPDRYSDQYPDGLKLAPGDAVILNNQCDWEQQLVHGAEMSPDIPQRLSYLFLFKNDES